MGGFEHCVANMYYVPAGLFAKMVPEWAACALESGADLTVLNWMNFLMHNLIPVTAGNVIGGYAFAALIWRAYRGEG